MALAIVPFQDLLRLGAGARMNLPGHADGKWRWRCIEKMMALPTFQWLRHLTRETKRLA